MRKRKGDRAKKEEAGGKREREREKGGVSE